MSNPKTSYEKPQRRQPTYEEYKAGKGLHSDLPIPDWYIAMVFEPGSTTPESP